VSDADDRVLAIEKDGVDRETHEEHVHRRLRSEQHPASWLELVPPEEPTHARKSSVGDLTVSADDSPVGSEDAPDRQPAPPNPVAWSFATDLFSHLSQDRFAS
jgi:hypothetical protein